MGLREHLDEQLKLNSHFVDFKGLNHEGLIRLAKDYIQCLQGEGFDLLECLDWKSHRREGKVFIKSNVVEELVDIYKYWLSLLLLFRITPEELEKGFRVKSRVVFQRYRQEWEKPPPGEDVVAIDIDGVLADYPKSFCSFMAKEMPDSAFIDWDYLTLENLDLYEQYGEAIGVGRMLELKDKYRESGEKRNIPVIPGAQMFLRVLRVSGLYVILLTARPMARYKRMFGDTIVWLDKNGLEYDSLLADEHKNIRVYNQFPNLRFMVEDSLQAAKSVASLGVRVYLIDRTYNQGDGRFTRVSGFKEILKQEGISPS